MQCVGCERQIRIDSPEKDACTHAQVVAGLRCRINKTTFLLGMLLGKRWAPDELFTSEAGARPEANAILSTMTSFLQKSSSVALASRCAHQEPLLVTTSRQTLPVSMGRAVKF